MSAILPPGRPVSLGKGQRRQPVLPRIVPFHRFWSFQAATCPKDILFTLRQKFRSLGKIAPISGLLTTLFNAERHLSVKDVKKLA